MELSGSALPQRACPALRRRWPGVRADWHRGKPAHRRCFSIRSNRFRRGEGIRCQHGFRSCGSRTLIRPSWDDRLACPALRAARNEGRRSAAIVAVQDRRVAGFCEKSAVGTRSTGVRNRHLSGPTNFTPRLAPGGREGPALPLILRSPLRLHGQTAGGRTSGGRSFRP